MLKGKTTIELTDVNTGEKKVYEDHNMVTNFAKYLFRNVGNFCDPTVFFSSNSNTNYYPYRKNMLGGLLLFDSEIDPKNGETIFAPTGASMAGCASYDATSTNDVRGSYNSSESYYNSQEKSMKYVYDFATNQANGTIKSVCLTSMQGGFGGYENANNVRNTTDTKYALFTAVSSSVRPNLTFNSETVLYAIDIDKDEAYYYKINSTTSVTLYTYEAGFTKKSIFSDPLNPGKLKSQTDIAVDIDSTAYKTGFYDAKTNTLHIIGLTNYVWTNETAIKVSKINLTDNTVENYTLTNNTGANITLLNNKSSYPDNLMKYAVVYDNIFYVCDNMNASNWYRIDSSGIKETKKIGTLFNTLNGYLVTACNGRILFCGNTDVNSNNYSSAYMYNPQTEVISPTAYFSKIGGQAIIPCFGSNEMLVYIVRQTTSSLYSYFANLNNYLATINNLETPIVKTDTNTMKVIYTITEE